MRNSRSNSELAKLSNKELLALLPHYHLYATSGANNPKVASGPEMLEELKRRLKEQSE